MKNNSADTMDTPEMRQKIQQLADERGISTREAKELLMKKHQSM